MLTVIVTSSRDGAAEALEFIVKAGDAGNEVLEKCK
jgi:hypothetical protein